MPSLLAATALAGAPSPRWLSVAPPPADAPWLTTENVRAFHDLCRAQAVPVWCGGMLETGIGRASSRYWIFAPASMSPTRG